MSRIGIFILFLIILVSGSLQAQTDSVETIIFIRHGEKPTLDYGQLKCEGWNRALHLPKVMFQKYGKPDAYFAPHPFFDNYYYYVRGLTSIEPMAIQMGKPVNQQFLYFQIDEVTAELLKADYHHSTIFVVWEHYNLVKIAKRIMNVLGGDERIIPNWPKDDFDSIFVFKIDWSAVKPTVLFNKQQENLNHQSKTCYVPPLKQTQVKRRELFFIPSAESLVGMDQLSCKGLNRALRLSHWFSMYVPTINRVFLPKPQNSPYLRSMMTIEPTLISRGGKYIPMGKNPADLIRELTSRVNCCETVVIVWDIENLGALIRSVYQAHGGDPQEVDNPIIDHDVVYLLSLSTGKKPILNKFSTYLNDTADVCPMALTGAI